MNGQGEGMILKMKNDENKKKLSEMKRSDVKKRKNKNGWKKRKVNWDGWMDGWMHKVKGW